MTVSKIPVDVKRLLSNALLVDVSPISEYKDGRKTDAIAGLRYVCVLPDVAYEKVSVKISGNHQQIEVEDSAIPVIFTDPVAKLYCINGQCDVTITASGIARKGGGDGKH